jgi:hypothetical protein
MAVEADVPSKWYKMASPFTSGTVTEMDYGPEGFPAGSATHVNPDPSDFQLAPIRFGTDSNYAHRFRSAASQEMTFTKAITADFSIESVFQWTAGTALLRDNTSANGWIIGFDNATNFAVRIGGTTITTSRTTAQVRNGATQHLVVTRVRTTATVWLNGANIGSATVATTAPTAPWHLARNGVGGAYADIVVDDLVYYDYGLSATQVATHWGFISNPE